MNNKFKRIGKELAYIISKFDNMYLSPNCCFNGECKPTDEDLGKLLIEPGSRIMFCPKCHKKYIVTRKGNEKEFHKVEIMEFIEPSEVLIHSNPVSEVAGSSGNCKSFEAMAEIIHEKETQESFKKHFMSGFTDRVSHLFNASIKNPRILIGKN
ncbi:MAG: hypothetical protein M0P71_01785 [Melioribacteraceae bacterium]|nr:hypothetical protein [Melioribacteraceae bacterium]